MARIKLVTAVTLLFLCFFAFVLPAAGFCRVPRALLRLVFVCFVFSRALYFFWTGDPRWYRARGYILRSIYSAYYYILLTHYQIYVFLYNILQGELLTRPDG